VPFEIVPGITSAVAVPAYAGIPVTHRDLSSSVHIVTGHERCDRDKSVLDFKALAGLEGTLVFLMGIKNIEHIVKELAKNGKKEETPVAVISRGTTPHQTTVVGTLKDICRKVKESGIGNPAVIVIGDVVYMRDQIGWHETDGKKRILLTRAPEQSAELIESLRDCGYQVISCPTVKIEPVYGAFEAFSRRIEEYDYLVFSSANSVKVLDEAMFLWRFDVRKLKGKKIAAVGAATAKALEKIHICVDIVPGDFTSDALAEIMAAEVKGKRVAVLTSDIGGEKLIEKLRQHGGYVDKVPLYHNVPNYEIKDYLIEQLIRGLDLAIFTSPSTFNYLIEIAGDSANLLRDVRIMAIGPVTSQAILEKGYKVDLMPQRHDTEGIIALIKRDG